MMRITHVFAAPELFLIIFGGQSKTISMDLVGHIIPKLKAYSNDSTVNCLCSKTSGKHCNVDGTNQAWIRTDQNQKTTYMPTSITHIAKTKCCNSIVQTGKSYRFLSQENILVMFNVKQKTHYDSWLGTIFTKSI